MPQEADLRECRLYRFYGWDPGTNYTTKTLIYIGETWREPFDRLMEHVARQPWADTIAGWEVDDRIYYGKEAVTAAERAAVEAEQPLYNDEFNRGNPARIELEEAKAQRWARDDAKGVPPWRPGSSRTMYRRGWEVPAPDNAPTRPYGSVQAPARTAPVRQRRPEWKPWQKRLTGWGCTWLALTITGWVAALHWHLGGWGWKQTGLGSAVTVTALMAWVACGAPIPVGMWERRARKVRRWLW